MLISLSICDSHLKDAKGRIVASLSPSLGEAKVKAYAHAFASSSDLLAYMADVISYYVQRFQRQEERETSAGLKPYTGVTTYPPLPDWVSLGAQASAVAQGQPFPHTNYKMKSDTILRPLSIEGNTLKDDFGTIIATISPDLGEPAIARYAGAFAASVYLLDLIDYKSAEDLREILREYKSAQNFNKHENLPGNVRPLGVDPPFIPDELANARRLVAAAKGEQYQPLEI